MSAVGCWLDVTQNSSCLVEEWNISKTNSGTNSNPIYITSVISKENIELILKECVCVFMFCGRK